MNTKPLRSICFSLLLCLMSAFASAAVFTSPGGYSLTLPTGWRAAPDRIKGEDAAFFLPQPGTAPGTMMPNVNIRILPGARKMTIATMKSFLNVNMKKLYPGTRIVSKTESSLGGVRDVDIVLRDSQHGEPIYIHQICVLKNNSLYIISTGYPEGQYAQDEPAIARMLASFHWKP